ncbi:MAG: hypothetical protein UZ12_BCD005002294, partial [Bacteroidetes bacterium OLB12]
KLNTAIRILLWFALAANAESIVNDVENPSADRSKVMAKSVWSASGFFKRITNNSQPVKDKIVISKKL